MTKLVNHLDKLAIFQIDFDIWSGQVKLESPDLKIDVDDAPDKEVVDLGRKFIIERKHLRPFNSLKTHARRLCLRHGMKFFEGAFAIPLDKIDIVSSELDEIYSQMLDIKSNFVANYDQWVDQWIQKKPEYADAIRIGRLPASVVEKRFGFDYQIYQMNPVNEAQSNKLNGMANGLADELMEEIVSEAESFYQGNLKGKEECQVTTQKTLKRLRDKVDGLSFLHSRFLSVVELLTKTINGYPSKGKTVGGEQYFRVLSATLILTSKTKIQEYASGAVDLEQMTNSYMSNSQTEDQTKTAAESKKTVSISSEVSSSHMDLTLPDDDELDQIFGSQIANGTSSYF